MRRIRIVKEERGFKVCISTVLSIMIRSRIVALFGNAVQINWSNCARDKKTFLLENSRLFLFCWLHITSHRLVGFKSKKAFKWFTFHSKCLSGQWAINHRLSLNDSCLSCNWAINHRALLTFTSGYLSDQWAVNQSVFKWFMFHSGLLWWVGYK